VDQDLPKEEWLRFFQELNRCAVMNVTLAGGEPFFRKDLKQLIEGIVVNRMRFNILSNGTLITDDMAKFLFSTGRCDGVQVSIDGSKPETHDACRGKGNFNKAIEGIRCLKKNHVPVQVRVTIHRYEDRTLAMETLLKLNRKYDNRISAQAGPLAEAVMWVEMEQARQKGVSSIPMGGSLTACGCVMDKIAVRADGALVPCTMLSHIELGRINRDDLKEIWQNHPEMKKMRERRNIPLNDFEFCRECQYINYCTGNCPGLAYTILGKVDHPSPDACLKHFLDDGGRLPDYL
jgi:radical SAM protein with 4Fe4S-binding SPASM domain